MVVTDDRINEMSEIAIAAAGDIADEASEDRHGSCEIHGSCVEPYPEPVNKTEALRMSPTSLAWLGDAVYETYVRKYIVDTGLAHADRLHTAAVRFVKAEAQAGVMKALLAGAEEAERGEMNPAASADGLLGEDEQALVRRARNKKNSTRPKNADPMDYKWATAFEALLGYYYVTEQQQKLEDVVLFALNFVESVESN